MTRYPANTKVSKFREGEEVEALKDIDNGNDLMTRRWQRWCKAIISRDFSRNRYEVEFRDGSHALLFGDEIRKEENR